MESDAVRVTVGDGDQVMDADEEGVERLDTDSESAPVSVKEGLREMLDANVEEIDGEAASDGVPL